MSLPPLKDLTPNGNPIGGSPKTPPPGSFPVRDYERYVAETTSNGMVWKVIASAGWSVALTMIVAWWTARDTAQIAAQQSRDAVQQIAKLADAGKGVSRPEMETYVKDYSPYVMDKGKLDANERENHQKISEIYGVQQEVLKRVSILEGQKK